MKLLTIPDEVREFKNDFLSKVFIKQQVKLKQYNGIYESLVGMAKEKQSSCVYESQVGMAKEKEISETPQYLPLPIPKNREEKVYRKNGRTVDKIHEFDFATNAKIKTTHFDYFNDKKIRSIDEFDIETGKIFRTSNFILYKSVEEFDLVSGKKIRTINYNLRDENKISSIQEYCLVTERISKVYIYRKDGSSVSIIKELNPETGKVIKWTSFKENTKKINSISEYEPENGKPVRTTYFYDDGVTVKDVHEYNRNGTWKQSSRFEKNKKASSKQLFSKVTYNNVRELDAHTKERMAKLIDNLFKKNIVKFECI